MAGRWERIGQHVSFDAPQRRVIGVLLSVLLLYGVIRLASHSSYISDPQPPDGDLAGQLANRLDPNTASASDLAALPGLGDKRAAAIVTRRETVRRREPTTVPFRSPDDLFYVPGFGRSMVDNLRPFLIFPTDENARDKNQTPP